jgi:hypothetical protein
MFPITQALINSAVLSIIFSVLVIVSLRWNPRLWIQDFPDALRATQAPLTLTENRQRTIFASLLLGSVIGTIILLNGLVRGQMGAAFTFPIAYAHTWIMLQIMNLVDAVLIDWVYIVKIQPKHLILPGTEHVMYVLEDKRWHFANFLKGVVICSILALVFAGIAMI